MAVAHLDKRCNEGRLEHLLLHSGLAQPVAPLGREKACTERRLLHQLRERALWIVWRDALHGLKEGDTGRVAHLS